MSMTPVGPKCECGWHKSWVGDDWQCKRCCVAMKTIVKQAAIERRKEINGVGYRHGGKARKHCAPVPEKKPRGNWRPKWANSKNWYSEIGVDLEILVQCVRAGREPRIKAKTS